MSYSVLFNVLRWTDKYTLELKLSKKYKTSIKLKLKYKSKRKSHCCLTAR